MSNKSFFSKLGRDLVSDEKRDYKVRLGYTLASSLFGLVCGAAISCIIWLIAFNYITNNVQNICGR